MIQDVIYWLFRAVRKLVRTFGFALNQMQCRILFYGQNIKYNNFKTKGLPYVSIKYGGECIIGEGFRMNNAFSGNVIGRSQRCVFVVENRARLQIGCNVGISQTALICHESITIGDHVKIGGGVCIYDTDFHSLDPVIRMDPKLDMENKIKLPVVIKDNAFIGAHSTILKGVTIGRNSIVGACSLVAKDIPDNEVWAGNPAKKIRSLAQIDLAKVSFN